MNEGNRASKEDIDLENAIGDVFGQFDFGSVDKEEGTNHQLQQDQLESKIKINHNNQNPNWNIIIPIPSSRFTTTLPKERDYCRTKANTTT